MLSPINKYTTHVFSYLLIDIKQHPRVYYWGFKPQPQKKKKKIEITTNYWIINITTHVFLR